MRTLVFLLSATILAIQFERVYSQCHLCGSEDIAIRNPNARIPLLRIPGPIPTTCQVAYNYGKIIDAADPMCEQLRQQSVYCQCSNTEIVSPDNACGLCNDGNSPQHPNRITPFGNTCQMLDQYLQSFTKDQCQNPNNHQYINDIKKMTFGCGCQDEAATCPMCRNDDSIDLAFPDRIIPFLSFIDVGGVDGLLSERSNPICQHLAMLASSEDPSSSLCQMARDNAGFCGCSGILPQNKCSFCPGGTAPAREDYLVPTLDTCGELNAYMSFMSEDDCRSERAREMQALNFLCGCKDSEAQCTLCPDGSYDFDPDLRPAIDGPSCLELALSISALPRDVCEEERDSIIGINAFRCGCPTAEVPVCATRENSHLCTKELLDQANQSGASCECFAFCDGEFVQCQDYPGGVLADQDCNGRTRGKGIKISGCNAAIAVPSNSVPKASNGMATRGQYKIAGFLIVAVLVLAVIPF